MVMNIHKYLLVQAQELLHFNGLPFPGTRRKEVPTQEYSTVPCVGVISSVGSMPIGLMAPRLGVQHFTVRVVAAVAICEGPTAAPPAQVRT